MAVRKAGLGKGLDRMFPVYQDTPDDKADNTAGVKEKTSKEKAKPARASRGAGAEGPAAPKKDDSAKKAEEEPKNAVLTVRISMVEPNREQPRQQFDEEALGELAESIKEHGIIQPLIVQKKNDRYEIIAGERRWRAAKAAGLKEVPVIVREFTDQETMEISLIENIQREDLNPIEEAQAYKRLMEEFSLRQEDIAGRVGKSRTAVTNAMRLLKLDQRVQEMVIRREISAGHARALLGVEDPERQYAIAKRVVEENLNVRDIERMMKTVVTGRKALKTPDISSTALDLIYQEMEDRMKSLFGTKVTVNRKTEKKGKIEIEYYSAEELERIYELINSIKHNM